MSKVVRAGLLLIVSAVGTSACTSLLGGFVFDGIVNGSGGSGGMMVTGGGGGTLTSGGGKPASTSTAIATSGTTGAGGAEPVDCTGILAEGVCATCIEGSCCAELATCDATDGCLDCAINQTSCDPTNKAAVDALNACLTASCATKCALNSGCTVAADCASGVCTGNVCSQINGCNLSTATDLTAVTTTAVAFGGALGLNYVPKCIKVHTSTLVTFNGSFSAHPLQGGTVVGGVGTPASSGPFATLTNTGTTSDFTMTSTGTFPYYCTAHAGSGMTGAVFVVP